MSVAVSPSERDPAGRRRRRWDIQRTAASRASQSSAQSAVAARREAAGRADPRGRPVQAWEEGGARWGSGSVGVARPQRRRRFGPPSSGAPKGFGSEAGKGAGRRGDDDGEDEVVEVADGRGSAEAAMAAHGKSEGHPGRVRR